MTASDLREDLLDADDEESSDSTSPADTPHHTIKALNGKFRLAKSTHISTTHRFKNLCGQHGKHYFAQNSSDYRDTTATILFGSILSETVTLQEV